MGVADGDEVVTSPLSFVASANVILYERARPVFADIDPVTLNLDPQATEAAVGERTRALLPVHLFGYPADLPEFERIAARHDLAIVEDACEALGARHRDGPAVGARGHPAVFGFYANKQFTTAEGGIVTLADEAMKVRIDSERNQGRAPDMGWLDHDRLGFNYRLSELACALGIVQLGAPAGDARRAGAGGGALPRGAGRHRGARAALRGRRRRRGGAGSCSSCSCPGAVTATRSCGRSRRERIQSKPYLPAIHLMSFYRERFGHREGEFPVCEDVAERSLALPFFPQITEGQIERVAERLRAIVSG